MPSSLSMLVTIALVVLWTLGAVSWFAAGLYGLKALWHPRPGVRLWSRATRWNPANVLLRPELLTEEGQRYRRRCLQALLLSLACVGGFLFFAAVTWALVQGSAQAHGLCSKDSKAIAAASDLLAKQSSMNEYDVTKAYARDSPGKWIVGIPRVTSPEVTVMPAEVLIEVNKADCRSRSFLQK